MYDYELPKRSIARYPRPRRTSARLFVYDKTQDTFAHHTFGDLVRVLRPPYGLFLNDSAVVPARLYFRSSAEKKVEVLILGPVKGDWAGGLLGGSGSDWRVCIGGGRRWAIGEVLIHEHQSALALTAERLSKDCVRFQWAGKSAFGRVLNQLAHVPLPPYLDRPDEFTDRTRYQTVYAHTKGSVAAPTAGLHFTHQLLDQLNAKGIPHYTLTLHVSGATFLPLPKAGMPRLHSEEVSISAKTIQALRSELKPIAVGTTSLRTLESLYWYGCYLAQNPNHPFCIPETPFEQAQPLPAQKALEIVAQKHAQNEPLLGRTALFLRPPYKAQLVRGLITNFHQPHTSLLALVEALIGAKWRTLYQEAISQKYRFLSYGDACLFLL